jgi:hypothetical protein
MLVFTYACTREQRKYIEEDHTLLEWSLDTSIQEELVQQHPGFS